MSSPLRNPTDALEYLRRLADGMALRDWTFALAPGLPVDVNDEYATQAEIQLHPHADIAFLAVAGPFFEEEVDVQRRILVHELLHCHRARTDYMVRHDLEDLVGKPADRLFWSGYSRQREVEVEAVAKVLAPFMPLP